MGMKAIHNKISEKVILEQADGFKAFSTPLPVPWGFQ